MRFARLVTAMVLLTVLAAVCATPGVFQGKVYQPTATETESGWLFVQSRNGMLRKVEISQARVEYAKSVPLHQREKAPANALVHGAEIRVTAVQDGQGEWRARRIEILKVLRPQAKRTGVGRS